MNRGWPERPSDATAKPIETVHGPCAVVDEGPSDAPVLVLFHGVPGTVRDFRWLAPCVRGELRVIRFDMPGFGGTPLRSGLGFDIVDRANFVVGLLDALGLDRVAVVGHSMGAAIALAVATHHSSRVSHLGLLASPGLRPHRKFRNTFPISVAKAMRLPVLGGLMRKVVKRGFTREGFPAAMGGADVQTVMDYAAGLDFAAHRRRVLSLSCPTLVAYCDNDHLIETEICAELADACPAGPRAVFPTGAHNLQKTHAIDLGQTLVKWLSVLSV